MRTLIVAGALLLLATSTTAQLPTARQPDKIPQPVEPNIPLAARQGGDSILTAFVIPALPFVTSGRTTGYNNDYDEVCPYNGSTAPDVVYAYSPPADTLIEIDLCGSSYDTKVYVYDAALNLVACNDDHYFSVPCGVYVSFLGDVQLFAGQTYYIVIDGYGATHGDYQLAINDYLPPPPCILLPSCSAQIENEPPLEDGYVDMYNGGCNSQAYGAPFMEMWVDPYGSPPEFFGSLGWYQGSGGQNYRDTDWLRVSVYSTWSVDVTIIAQQPVALYHLSPTNCQNAVVINHIMVDSCTEGTMTVSAPGTEPIWLVVAPQTFTPSPGYSGGEFNYRLGFYGMSPSCMYLGPDSDYSFGGESFQVNRYYTYFSTGQCHDDLDLQSLCGTTNATPGGDTMVPVYLEAGQTIAGEWWPYWIKANEEEATRSSTYIALLSDLRGDSPGCADVATLCPGYNCLFGVTAQETGWHWLVIDTSYTDNTNQWGGFGISHLVTPPPPPAHDTCAGAVPIPVGTFYHPADLTTATNKFDPGRDGCPGAPDLAYTSRDVVYEVSLLAGHTLDATLVPQGGWDATLYLVQSCEEPMGACVAAGEQQDGSVRLRYTSTVDQVLWLVCDSYGLGERPYILHGSLGQVTSAPPTAPRELSVQAAPNPFNPATRISYTLPRSGPVLLKIVTLDGKLLRTLANDDREAGQHDILWDGRDASGRLLASGVYLVSLSAGGEAVSARVLLLK